MPSVCEPTNAWFRARCLRPLGDAASFGKPHGIDEIPGAYKDIEAVMAAQADLVEVVHTLKQIMCIKG